MTLKGLQGVIDEVQEQGLKGVELLRVRWQILGTLCQVLSLEVMLERGTRGLRGARGARGAAAPAVEQQSSLVTDVFALATLTFLHVTVSGAFPWLPRVRASVARTMETLVALPVGLLMRVSWPFAVAGCMVLEEQRDVVRGVFEGRGGRGLNTGTVWKAMGAYLGSWSSGCSISYR